jgi:hypothetical protein
MFVLFNSAFAHFILMTNVPFDPFYGIWLLSRNPVVLHAVGTVSRAFLRILGIARRTLRLRLRELGLSVTRSVEGDEDDAIAPE